MNRIERHDASTGPRATLRFLGLFAAFTLVACTTSTISDDAPGDPRSAGDTHGSGDEATGDTDPGDPASPGDSTSVDPCDPTSTGLIAKLPECTPARPCVRATAPSDPPVTVSSESPLCDDGRWDEIASQVIDGTTRYACISRPASASSTSLRPLVLFFHGGGAGAADVQNATTLLDRHEAFDLTGASAPQRLGFTLVSVHGRRIFFPTNGDRNGEYHHDFYYRDLSSPSSNPDIANADAWIDRIVAEGIVDPQRIYLMGWSNGAFFSQLYAVARNDTPTPGGSRVAAAAVFAAADPFHDIVRDPFTNQLRTGGNSCRLTTYPTSSVPILLTYKTCDITVSCGPTGADCFDPNPGFHVPNWLIDSQARGISNVTGFMLNGIETGQTQNSDATSCTDLSTNCNSADCEDAPMGAWCLCLFNHLRWPNGADRGGGDDREPGMLQYLRGNPLPL